MQVEWVKNECHCCGKVHDVKMEYEFDAYHDEDYLNIAEGGFQCAECGEYTCMECLEHTGKGHREICRFCWVFD